MNKDKQIIKELLDTYVINLDENGDIKSSIPETLDLLKRAADSIKEPEEKYQCMYCEKYIPENKQIVLCKECTENSNSELIKDIEDEMKCMAYLIIKRSEIKGGATLDLTNQRNYLQTILNKLNGI